LYQFVGMEESRFTKRKFENYEESDKSDKESPIYKAHKLNELNESSFIYYQYELYYPRALLYYMHELKENTFDLDIFLQNQTVITPTLAPIPRPVHIPIFINSFICSVAETYHTLTELNRICEEPIKKICTEEDKLIEKEITKIAKSLKDNSKIYQHEYGNLLKTNEHTEIILIEGLKKIFNTLVFRNYDFVDGGFNPEHQHILYEQVYKVSIYIRKSETGEIIIYFRFPFYVLIRINTVGKIFTSRNNIFKKFETVDEIEKIHYSSTNTGFNTLDLITAAKFIRLITSSYFKSGLDLFSKLTHILEIYKRNADALEYNKLPLNFKRFVNLYKQVITNTFVVPIRD
jgi:hypothetical protein